MKPKQGEQATERQPASEGEAAGEKAQTVSQPQPASEAVAPAESRTDAPASEPQQQISILDPEPREIDFSKFDLAALEGKSVSERREHADSMELPELGTFIRPAVVGIKRLVGAFRPYVQNYMERTAHQGEQRMLTNMKGEPASREEVVREQLGVGVRRVNQLLAATGPEPPKSSTVRLTETQDAVVKALIAQGYKKKDSLSMVKAAAGDDFESLFRSALSHQASKPIVAVREHEEKLNGPFESGQPETLDESLPGEDKREAAADASNDGFVQDGAEQPTEDSDESTPNKVPLFLTEKKVHPDADELKAAISAEPDGSPTTDEGSEPEERPVVDQEGAGQTLENGAQLPAPVEPENDDDDDALFTQYDPNKELPGGRPIYKIMLTVTGSRLEATMKKAQEAFGDKLLNVEKVSRISSRADQMAEAVGLMEDAKSACEELKEQIESWKDNLPENFQEKSSQLEECMDALEQVINSLDEAQSNAESVEFPGMY